jgi:acyl-CoA thioester hydrolase
MMANEAVVYERMVQWGETDAAGIVFYPNFYKWMDEATHHLFRVKGYPQSVLYEQQKTALPILEAHCQFKSPALFENELRIESRIVEVKEKVFKVSHRFLHGERFLAEGYEVRAWTDFSGGKPKAVPIPDEHRRWMEAMAL